MRSLICLTTLALIGCKHPAAPAGAEAPSSASDAPTDAPEAPTAAPEATTAKEDAPEPWGDAYTVTAEPRVEGLQLLLAVQYGGGCEAHTFTAIAGPRDAAAPTLQPITVRHDANDDHCRAIKHEEIEVSLEDALGADCTERILLVAPGVKRGGHVIALARPQGCD